MMICKACNVDKDPGCFEFRKDSGTYRRKCRECRRKYQRDRKRRWYLSNKEHEKSVRKVYYTNNKESIDAKRRQYMRKWHQNKKQDPMYRIKRALRARLNSALKGNYKTGSAIRDLGCSIDDFMVYISDKFSKGMTWDNYGKWHIDHIIPLASFDLSNEGQVKEACNYKNLQPLWAKDNLSKGDRKC